MDQPYILIEPEVPVVPFIVSVPHCGTEIPDEIREHYVSEMAAQPDDTDWFVHHLYNFASELGITIIHARYSRWVIDLNRDPESKPLYDDGRIITGLTPHTDFFGRNIYVSNQHTPNEEEISRRLEMYYWPYYQAVRSLLNDRLERFGSVLLWDAHSIRQYVPTIRQERFPDMILGNNDQTTASDEIIQVALSGLEVGPFEVSHNTPFKGGHITRYFGEPEKNVHALQLEMNKVLYMDDAEVAFDEERADLVRSVLRPMFIKLIQELG